MFFLLGNMSYARFDVVVIADHFRTKTFSNHIRSWIKYLKLYVDSGVKSKPLQHISIDEHFHWFLRQTILFKSLLPKLLYADVDILTCCIHMDYVCFISLHIINKIPCFVRSHRSQKEVVKNPNGCSPAVQFWTAVSQACPSDRRSFDTVIWSVVIPIIKPVFPW